MMMRKTIVICCQRKRIMWCFSKQSRSARKLSRLCKYSTLYVNNEMSRQLFPRFTAQTLLGARARPAQHRAAPALAMW